MIISYTKTGGPSWSHRATTNIKLASESEYNNLLADAEVSDLRILQELEEDISALEILLAIKSIYVERTGDILPEWQLPCRSIYLSSDAEDGWGGLFDASASAYHYEEHLADILEAEYKDWMLDDSVGESLLDNAQVRTFCNGIGMAYFSHRHSAFKHYNVHNMPISKFLEYTGPKDAAAYTGYHVYLAPTENPRLWVVVTVFDSYNEPELGVLLLRDGEEEELVKFLKEVPKLASKEAYKSEKLREVAELNIPDHIFKILDVKDMSTTKLGALLELMDDSTTCEDLEHLEVEVCWMFSYQSKED